MSFMSQVAFYFGVVDAVLIMVFGVVIALAFLFGRKDVVDKLMDRAFPALAIIVGASIAAALVLGAIRWLTGYGGVMDPFLSVAIILAAAAAILLYPRRPAPRMETAPVVDQKKPPVFEVPKVEPVQAWPPDVQRALLELVAFTVNQRTTMLNFNLNDLSHEGRPLGSFRITIERIED